MDIDMSLLEGEDSMQKTTGDFDHFLKTVRTGQASTEVLEGIHADVPAYGGFVPLKSVALTSKQDAQMLVVKPFDPKTIKDIEKALSNADLGLSISNDGKIIRLAFPPMSEERRKQTVKAIKERLEQHKVSLRNIRKDMIKNIEGNKGQPGVSEDMIEKAKEEVQKLIKQFEAQMDLAFEKKSVEVMKI